MNTSQNDLALYLKLDDLTSDGKVKDHRDQPLGTKRGNPQVVDDELFGKCLKFDGSSCIEVPYEKVHSDSTTFTVSCWAKVEGGSGYRSPITFRDEFPTAGYILYADPQNKWVGWIGGGQTEEDLRAGRGTWSTTTGRDLKGGSVTLNYWAHVTLTYNDNQLSLYVNGQLQDSITPSKRFVPVSAARARPMRIGAGVTEKTDPSFYFNGCLAHVRIYNKALTKDEIRRDMALDVSPQLREEIRELVALRAKSKEWEEVQRMIDGSKTGSSADVRGFIERVQQSVRISDKRTVIVKDWEKTRKLADDARKLADDARKLADKAREISPDTPEADKVVEAANLVSSKASDAEAEFLSIENSIRENLMSLGYSRGEDLEKNPTIISTLSSGSSGLSDEEMQKISEISNKLDTIKTVAEKAHNNAVTLHAAATTAEANAKSYLDKAKNAYENWGSISVLFSIETSQSGNASTATNQSSSSSFEKSEESSSWVTVKKLFSLSEEKNESAQAPDSPSPSKSSNSERP